MAQDKPYFQQEVNYKIDVTLDDKTHMLKGFMELEYINNSPDTIHELLIHLWPNAYKNAKTAMSKQKIQGGDYFMLWASQKDKGYIDSLEFRINKKKADWMHYEGYEDIAYVWLDKLLAPGEKLTLTTPFVVKLPSGSISRLGHVGESYQITQWYPKPAVYDKDGWHEMPYLTQGEFYSEFGSYDVSITLPENYIVGATGDLQTESEIERMEALSKLPLPEQTFDKRDIIGEDTNGKISINRKDEFPPSSTKTKTLRYKQSNVHDFGWFADKRWIVRKGETTLPHTKKKVTTWALFTPQNSAVWENAGIKAINDGLYYYSLWSGDYPYKQCTAVDGTISAGGGMEYPNVTVIGNAGNEQSLATVIIHEVGHNWFYGILGSNERNNAWMDEGINSFFETRTMLATDTTLSALSAIGLSSAMLTKKLSLNDFSYQYMTEELVYLLSARNNNDQPMQMPSEYFTGMNYGTIVYKKTALAFNYLMQYLGEDMMNKCMSAYFDTWKFKHPGPDDLRLIFETTSGKDLSWFFDTLVNTTAKLDFKTSAIKKKNGGYDLSIYNKGEIAAPVCVDVLRDNQLKSRTWVESVDPHSWTHTQIAAQRGDVIKLNNLEGIPEYDKNNNTIRTKGVMRRMEPTTFKLLTGIDDPNHSQIFWNPLVGWNNYNKWMLGVQLHNQVLPSRNYNWSFAPMYSISTNNVNGFAKLESYNGKVGFGVRGQKFSYDTYQFLNSKRIYSYMTIVPYIKANLFSSRYEKNWSGLFMVELFDIRNWYKVEGKDFATFDASPLYHDFLPDNKRLNHIRVKANAKMKMLRSELRFTASVEGGDYTNYALFHQYSASYDYMYHGKTKSKIRTRLYYGGGNKTMLLNTSGQNGVNDYAYDGLFLGRTENNGILSNQFLKTQGGLAMPISYGFNKHLLSLNAEMDLPIKLPLSIYAGIARGVNNNTKGTTVWVVGANVPLIRNIFEVYLPIAYSKNVMNEIDSQQLKFSETIMFQLNLNMANPFELIRNLGL